MVAFRLWNQHGRARESGADECCGSNGDGMFVFVESRIDYVGMRVCSWEGREGTRVRRVGGRQA